MIRVSKRSINSLTGISLLIAFPAPAMELEVQGDKHQYVSGSFTLKDSSFPLSPAIGIERIKITLEYHVSDEGVGEAIPVPGTCTLEPDPPFVFSEQQLLRFNCSAAVESIPAAATRLQVSACVEVFKRDHPICYTASSDEI